MKIKKLTEGKIKGNIKDSSNAPPKPNISPPPQPTKTISVRVKLK